MEHGITNQLTKRSSHRASNYTRSIDVTDTGTSHPDANLGSDATPDIFSGHGVTDQITNPSHTTAKRFPDDCSD